MREIERGGSENRKTDTGNETNKGSKGREIRGTEIEEEEEERRG